MKWTLKKNCGVKANLRENKVLDKLFSTVSINTLPVYKNDMKTVLQNII